MAKNEQKIQLFFNQFQQKIIRLQKNIPYLIDNEAVNATIENFKTKSFYGQK